MTNFNTHFRLNVKILLVLTRPHKLTPKTKKKMENMHEIYYQPQQKIKARLFAYGETVCNLTL